MRCKSKKIKLDPCVNLSFPHRRFVMRGPVKQPKVERVESGEGTPSSLGRGLGTVLLPRNVLFNVANSAFLVQSL